MSVVGCFINREHWLLNMHSTGIESMDRREESRCEWCPLSQVRAGAAVRIKQLCAAPELQHRLREIGLGEEQIIRVVTGQANFICQVCNARLAISAQLARVILVEPMLEPVRI